MSMLFGLQNGNFTDQTKNKPKLVKNEKKLKTVLFLGKGGITLAAQGEAKKNTKTPTLIEFIIDPEEMVYPMIKPGGTLEDMIMDC